MTKIEDDIFKLKGHLKNSRVVVYVILVFVALLTLLIIVNIVRLQEQETVTTSAQAYKRASLDRMLQKYGLSQSTGQQQKGGVADEQMEALPNDQTGVSSQRQRCRYGVETWKQEKFCNVITRESYQVTYKCYDGLEGTLGGYNYMCLNKAQWKKQVDKVCEGRSSCLPVREEKQNDLQSGQEPEDLTSDTYDRFEK